MSWLVLPKEAHMGQHLTASAAQLHLLEPCRQLRVQLWELPLHEGQIAAAGGLAEVCKPGRR